MKIFIVKGKVKGMVKLDKKLHISLNDNSNFKRVVLCEKYQKIKVLEKKNLNDYIADIEADSIVFLDDMDGILAAGATNGKVDLEKILRLYFKQKPCENRHQTQKNEHFEDKKTINEVKNNEALLINAENLTNFVDEREFEVETNIGKFNKESVVNVEVKNSIDNKIKSDIYIEKNEEIDKGVDFVLQAIEEEQAKPKTDENFFLLIKNDIESFFAAYQKNEELENAVYNSRWVMIEEEFPYSVGVIYDENTPSIIAYALPYESKGEISYDYLATGEWLAANKNIPDGRGYLLFYQNASSGEMITQ